MDREITLTIQLKNEETVSLRKIAKKFGLSEAMSQGGCWLLRSQFSRNV